MSGKRNLVCAGDEKLSPLVIEISWSHNLVILGSCKDNLEREFYIRMTKKHGWSKNVLIHQIEVGAYANTLTSQTNFDDSLRFASLDPNTQLDLLS